MLRWRRNRPWSQPISSFPEMSLILPRWLRNQPRSQLSMMLYSTIMGLLRIIRRWNQTGQKFTGEPDIAKGFLLMQKLYLWVAVASTYIGLSGLLFSRYPSSFSRTTRGVVSISLGLVAIIFKLAFVNNDAPELLHGFPKLLLDLLERQSLDVLARMVFLGLIVTVIGIIFLQWRENVSAGYLFEFS